MMLVPQLDHQVNLEKETTSVYELTLPSRRILQLIIAVMLACYVHASQASTFRNRQAAFATDSSGQELKRLVESYGPDEQDVNLRKLLSIPRRQLISRLLELKSGRSNSVAFKVRVAFLFCRLNYRYDYNRNIIRSKLSKPGHADADTTISMMGALIARGDRALLSDLFSASEWSDGAASGAITDVFLEETENHLASFLRALKLRPWKVRLGVYRFLSSAWTQDQLSNLTKSLNQVPQTGQLRFIRGEMLRALKK